MGSTSYVDVKSQPTPDPSFTNALIITQVVDNFQTVRNKGWYCGNSMGEGLARALADELYPNKLREYSTASYWLSEGAPDWVSQTEPTDQNPESVSCSVLFLNYLHYQLGIPWEKIVQNGGTTLGETYSNLGLGNDAFSNFVQVVVSHFAKRSPLTTDNPFPL